MKYIVEHCSCGVVFETENYCELLHYLYENLNSNFVKLISINEIGNCAKMNYSGGYTVSIKQ